MATGLRLQFDAVDTKDKTKQQKAAQKTEHSFPDSENSSKSRDNLSQITKPNEI